MKCNTFTYWIRVGLLRPIDSNDLVWDGMPLIFYEAILWLEYFDWASIYPVWKFPVIDHIGGIIRWKLINIFGKGHQPSAISHQANGQLEHMRILELIMALSIVAIGLFAYRTYYYNTLKLQSECHLFCGLSIGYRMYWLDPSDIFTIWCSMTTTEW